MDVECILKCFHFISLSQNHIAFDEVTWPWVSSVADALDIHTLYRAVVIVMVHTTRASHILNGGVLDHTPQQLPPPPAYMCTAVCTRYPHTTTRIRPLVCVFWLWAMTPGTQINPGFTVCSWRDCVCVRQPEFATYQIQEDMNLLLLMCIFSSYFHTVSYV